MGDRLGIPGAVDFLSRRRRLTQSRPFPVKHAAISVFPFVKCSASSYCVFSLSLILYSYAHAPAVSIHHLSLAYMICMTAFAHHSTLSFLSPFFFIYLAANRDGQTSIQYRSQISNLYRLMIYVRRFESSRQISLKSSI